MKMNIKLLDDRIMVEPEPAPSRSRGGILLPDRRGAVELQPKVGFVIKVGDGRIAEAFPNWTRTDPQAEMQYTPQRLPLRVKVGDRIVYNGYSETIWEREGHKYTLITERDVIGVFSDAAVDATARRDGP